MSKIGRNVFFQLPKFKAMITGTLAILLHWPLPIKGAIGNDFVKIAAEQESHNQILKII